MESGTLRHRVTVELRTDVSDGHDGVVETWAALHARIPAMISPLHGRDLERARQIDPRISHEVALRFWRSYHDDLASGRARLVYHDTEDRTFEIVAPPLDVDERHIELRLMCQESAA